MTTVTPVRSTSTLVQFLLTGIVWGSSFLFIAIALTGISPTQVVAGRLTLGALTLGAIVALRRERLPRSAKIWAHMTIVSLTFSVVPFLLFAWAQQYVSSGLASIYNATTPLMTALMAWAVFRIEKLSPMQIAGLLVGIAGVMVIIAPWQDLDGNESVIAQLAILGATASYGFSFGYQRKFAANTGMSSVVFSFLTIGIGAVIMLVLSPLIAWTPMHLTPQIIGAMLALGCLGTGIAYIWNQNTLRAWGPTKTSTVTYLTPVVGVFLGILVLGEPLTWNEPVGGFIVFVGILLAQGRLRLRTKNAPTAVRR